MIARCRRSMTLQSHPASTMDNIKLPKPSYLSG